MKLSKFLLGSLLIVAICLLAGCATTGVMSKTGQGVIYQNNKEAVTATEVDGSKMGRSCSSNVLGIATTGDSSVHAAKQSGGISKVSSVDVTYFRILSLYGKSCTIVRGK